MPIRIQITLNVRAVKGKESWLEATIEILLSRAKENNFKNHKCIHSQHHYSINKEEDKLVKFRAWNTIYRNIRKKEMLIYKLLNNS